MKNSTPCLDSRELSLAISQTSKPRAKKLGFSAKIAQLFQQLVLSLVSKPEPQIWQKKDRFGETYWQVYDPTSGASAYLDSEAEVRTWLEKRYYA